MGISEEEIKLREFFDSIPDSNDNIEPEETIKLLSENGVENVLLRAKQQAEIKWTPKKTVYCYYNKNYSFPAGKEVEGIPYGQPVGGGGKYVPQQCSFSEFINNVNDSNSAFYDTYYGYGNVRCPKISSDCSAFVSYCWGINRTTTSNMPSVSGVLSKGTSVYNLKVGDAINRKKYHIILITGLQYDENGSIVYVETTEQTPPKVTTRLYTAATFQSLINNNGYSILRYSGINDVGYDEDSAVPMEDKIIYSIDKDYSNVQTPCVNNNGDLFIRGWVMSINDINRLIYKVNGNEYTYSNWIERQDVLNANPTYPKTNCGFEITIPKTLFNDGNNTVTLTAYSNTSNKSCSLGEWEIYKPVLAPSAYKINVSKSFVNVGENFNINYEVLNGASCTAKLVVYRVNDGKTETNDIGSNKSLTVSFPTSGTYKLYLELSNAGGNFKGSTSRYYAQVVVMPSGGYIKGDINNDGKVSITDLSILLKAIIGTRTLTADQQKRADVNGDGGISISDLSRMKKYLVGLITEF